MGKIGVFNFVSVDGYFAGPNGEIDWFKELRPDDAFDRYTRESSQSGGALMFGRTTYEMMKSYWPTEAAIKDDPRTAEVLNNSPKIVFSKTLKNEEDGPVWKDVRLFRDIRPDVILELKQGAGKGITILGSGSIVRQLTDLGLIEDYTLVQVPIIIGSGLSMFKNAKRTNLVLMETRSFGNGAVLLRYQPAG